MQLSRLRALAWVGLIAGAAWVSGQSSPARMLVSALVLLRVWGANDQVGHTNPMLEVVTRLETAYTLIHPEVSFANQLRGNDSALGAMYVGAADVVFMTRPPLYFELDGYQQAIPGQTPLQVDIMRGSSVATSAIPPLVLIVNRANPLNSLSLKEISLIFNGRHCGDSKGSYTWRGLGLTGPMGRLPIRLFGVATGSDAALVFSSKVFGRNPRWACNYIESANGTGGDRHVVDEVRRDPGAIGLTTANSDTSTVKVLAIAGDSGKGIFPTADTLASGLYPLGRTVVAFARRSSPPGTESAVSNFLTFLVSPEGQAIVGADTRFIRISGAQGITQTEINR